MHQMHCSYPLNNVLQQAVRDPGTSLSLLYT